MLERISLIAQSAIRIENRDNQIIYFDSFRLDSNEIKEKE